MVHQMIQINHGRMENGSKRTRKIRLANQCLNTHQPRQWISRPLQQGVQPLHLGNLFDVVQPHLLDFLRIAHRGKRGGVDGAGGCSGKDLDAVRQAEFRHGFPYADLIGAFGAAAGENETERFGWFH